jgi:hypothetical protein
VIALIAEIVEGTPRLDSPGCIRHPEMFDGEDEMFTEIALACKHSCPAATRRICLQWARPQPAGLLRGVIGGELLGATT